MLVRIKTTVPPLTAYVAAFDCLASLIVFLYLIDHVGKALRPSGVLRRVAIEGTQVIEPSTRGAWRNAPDESREPPHPAAEPAAQSPAPRTAYCWRSIFRDWSAWPSMQTA